MSGSFPMLSVIMPVRNGEKYLAEALDSILAQPFGFLNLSTPHAT